MDSERDEVGELLNSYGNDGWEIILIEPFGMYVWIYLKREIEP